MSGCWGELPLCNLRVDEEGRSDLVGQRCVTG